MLNLSVNSWQGGLGDLQLFGSELVSTQLPQKDFSRSSQIRSMVLRVQMPPLHVDSELHFVLPGREH